MVRHFIGDWRMSPITLHRPDPNQAISPEDMNSWDRIDPARGAQTAWTNSAGGYAIYRADVTLPRRVQTRGGEVVFHAIAGEAEVLLNGQVVAAKPQAAAGAVRFGISSSLTSPMTVSVLIRGDSAHAGLVQSVEILPA
jgi:beta-galactosidase